MGGVEVGMRNGSWVEAFELGFGNGRLAVD